MQGSSGCSWVLAAVLISAALPWSYVRLGVLALALCVVLQRSMGKHVGGIVPIGLSLLVFWAAASALWSAAPALTALRALELIGYMWVATHYVRTLDLESVHRSVLSGFKILILASAGLEILRLAGVSMIEFEYTAMQGVLANPNLLAFVCALGIIAILTATRDWFASRLSRVGYIAIGLFLLLNTRSEGGLVYLALGLAVTFLLIAAVRRTGLWRLGAAAVLCALPLLFLRPSLVWVRRIVGLEENDTLSGRTLLWGGALSGIRENPWLGVGLGALNEPAASPTADIQRAWLATSLNVFNAHNGLLEHALALGIPATILMVVVIATGMWRWLFLHVGDPGRATLWAASTLCMLVIWNVTETRILSPAIAWFLLVLLLVAGLHHGHLYRRR